MDDFGRQLGCLINGLMILAAVLLAALVTLAVLILTGVL